MNNRIVHTLAASLVVLTTWLAPSLSFTPTYAQTPQEPENVLFIPMLPKGDLADSGRGQIPLPPPNGNWLAFVNYYRALAYLPPVQENAAWQEGSWAHSRYMVKNDQVAHSEDPGNPWYTPQGNLAGQSGNLAASSNHAASDQAVIEWWMQAPFHAVSILDPALMQVGFGSFREQDGGLQMGATLDVLRGLAGVPQAIEYPIFWPADGMEIPISMYFGERPDPLASCPGYAAPSGLPIIVQFGQGDKRPEVTEFSVRQGEVELESCAFSEVDYNNPIAAEQALGRGILDSRDAVVVIPRMPLVPGGEYSVSLTVNGMHYDWSFQVSASPLAPESFAP